MISESPPTSRPTHAYGELITISPTGFFKHNHKALFCLNNILPEGRNSMFAFETQCLLFKLCVVKL